MRSSTVTRLLTPALLVLAMLVGFTGNATASVCPNDAVRASLHSEALPDCRAYELVSPVVKYGQPVFAEQFSSDGSRMTIGSIGSFAGSNQTSLENHYDVTRTSHGWATAPLNTPIGFVNPVFAGATAESPDLREGLFQYQPLSTTDARDRRYYVRSLPDGAPIEVGPIFSHEALAANPPIGIPNVSSPSVSRDLSHVLFMIAGPNRVHRSLEEPPEDYTWPGDTTAVARGLGFDSLYEYVGTDNSTPVLVGRDDTGHLVSDCGISIGSPYRGSFVELVGGGDIYNAVSADGMRVVFTAAGPCGPGVAGPSANDLFVREEQSGGASRLVNVSEPSSEDCAECVTSSPEGAVFQGASEDGSKVFFLSSQHLLGGAEGTSLFEYDFGAAQGARVVLVAPNVEGVSRVSEDGSHVYFVATSILTTGSNAAGRSPQAGADNLYVYERDADHPTGHTAFIGTLVSTDGMDWSQEDNRPVDATPDGHFIVFTSGAPLTADDTVSPTAQIFEYDALTETLVRVSSSQGLDNANGEDYSATIAYPNYVGGENATEHPTSISNDGATVVFQSEAALTLHAISGYPNVYEYHFGKLSLISDGQDHSFLLGGALPTTRLIGMDGSGQDILFTSADQLVPQDTDTQEDIYDARSGGGFVTTRVSACEGDACQGAFAVAPGLSSPATQSQPPGEQALNTAPKSTVKKAKSVKHKPKHRKRTGKRARKARRLAHVRIRGGKQ